MVEIVKMLEMVEKLNNNEKLKSVCISHIETNINKLKMETLILGLNALNNSSSNPNEEVIIQKAIANLAKDIHISEPDEIGINKKISYIPIKTDSYIDNDSD